jgi:hypothetical protein
MGINASKRCPTPLKSYHRNGSYFDSIAGYFLIVIKVFVQMYDK